MARWGRDQGSDDFPTREAASRALPEAGLSVAPAAWEAARSPDPEVRSRADGLAIELERRSLGALRAPGGEFSPDGGRPGRPCEALARRRVAGC